VDLDPLPAIRARLTLVEPAQHELDLFEMAGPIQSPAKCKVRSAIRFLNVKCERLSEIHKQIFAVYAKVMNLQNVMKWCGELSEGRTDVHYEHRSDRASLISEDFLLEIEGEIRAN
jgi:hypothetical protein